MSLFRLPGRISSVAGILTLTILFLKLLNTFVTRVAIYICSLLKLNTLNNLFSV